MAFISLMFKFERSLNGNPEAAFFMYISTTDGWDTVQEKWLIINDLTPAADIRILESIANGFLVFKTRLQLLCSTRFSLSLAAYP